MIKQDHFLGGMIFNMYTIYGKTGCATCIQAKQLLETKGLEYEYALLGLNYSLDEFYNVAPKTHRTFPMVAKDGNYIGGLTELKEVLATKYSK